jgi:hypothetical protein
MNPWQDPRFIIAYTVIVATVLVDVLVLFCHRFQIPTWSPLSWEHSIRVDSA